METRSEGRRRGAELERDAPRWRGGREVRVGLFVLIGAAASLWILFLTTDPATFRGRYMVTTTVPEAMGLRKGDPVQMRGVNIGRVHGLRALARHRGRRRRAGDRGGVAHPRGIADPDRDAGAHGAQDGDGHPGHRSGRPAGRREPSRHGREGAHGRHRGAWSEGGAPARPDDGSALRLDDRTDRRQRAGPSRRSWRSFRASSARRGRSSRA